MGYTLRTRPADHTNPKRKRGSPLLVLVLVFVFGPKTKFGVRLARARVFVLLVLVLVFGPKTTVGVRLTRTRTHTPNKCAGDVTSN
jgi:hypothetical protein